MQQGLVRLVRPFSTPTRFFVIVALVTGVAVAVLARPFSGDDEPTHFWRAYAITRGDLMLQVRGYGVGSELPSGVVNEGTRLFALGTSPRSDTWRRWDATVHDGPDEFVSYPMAQISPLGHVPAAIGVGIGRLFGASPLLLMLLGRLANLSAYIGIVYSILRVVPVLRWPLAFVGVFPNAIYVAATISPDAFAVAMVIATVGLALLMRDRVIRGVPIGRATWIAAFVAAVALGNAKGPYFLAIGLFVLPWLRAPRGNTRRLLVGAALVTVAVGGIWSLGFGDRYVLRAYVGPEHAFPIERLLGGSRHPPGLDSTAQWKALRENPTRIVAATGRMVVHEGRRVFSESLFDYGLWVPAWWLAALGFAFLFLVRFSTPEPDRPHLTALERTLAWLLLALVTGLMLLSLFVYDTPAHQQAVEINGMQGRYVAPLLPLLVLALPTVPRLRARVGVLAVGQVALSGVAIFAAAFGTYPPIFVQIFRDILR